MGKQKGRSDWDEAMEATGHRVVKKEEKKWPNRLRTTTRMVLYKNDSLVEDDFLKFLENLEKDNYDDEEETIQEELTANDLKLEQSRKRRKLNDLKPELTKIPSYTFKRALEYEVY
ncbi:hypothetical protein WA158_006747 [Blastocystis sp. Blastoise]